MLLNLVVPILIFSIENAQFSFWAINFMNKYGWKHLVLLFIWSVFIWRLLNLLGFASGKSNLKTT